jgi:hypothetical protein
MNATTAHRPLRLASPGTRAALFTTWLTNLDDDTLAAYGVGRLKARYIATRKQRTPPIFI